MPAYNTGMYIAKAIDSVLAQTFADWELIIVNDGSADDTLDVAKGYAAIDKRIRIIEQKNAGLAVARNNALRIARGEWIGFVDSDDTIDSDFYDKLLAAAKNANADIAIARMFVTEKFYGFIKPGVYTGFAKKISIFPNGSCCDKLFYARLIQENGIEFPAGLYFEDVLFLICAAFYANKIVSINDTFYNYRTRDNSIIRTASEAMIAKRNADKLIIANMIFDFAYERAKDKKTRNEINEFVMRCILEKSVMKNWQCLPPEFIKWAKWHKFVKFFYDNNVSRRGKIRKIRIFRIPVYITRSNT